MGRSVALSRTNSLVHFTANLLRSKGQLRVSSERKGDECSVRRRRGCKAKRLCRRGMDSPLLDQNHCLDFPVDFLHIGWTYTAVCVAGDPWSCNVFFALVAHITAFAVQFLVKMAISSTSSAKRSRR